MFFNVASKLIPILLGIITLPIIIGNVGTERFGIISITWLVIGYFTIFDLGLSKSIINQLALDLKNSDGLYQSEIISTLSYSLLSLGLVSGVVIFTIAPYLVLDVLNISQEFHHEAITALRVVSFGVPFTLISSGFRGVLETNQRFEKTAIADIFNAFGVYLGLSILTHYQKSIDVIVIYLVLVRMVVFVILYLFSKRHFNRIWALKRKYVNHLKSSIQFGSWIAVSNLINPLMGQIDRYVIGAIISMSAVSFYSAPLELIIKMNIIPASIASVLFPAFSLTRSDKKKSKALFKNSHLLIIVVTLPLIVTILLFANEALLIWLGNEFASNSTIIVQIIVVGVFFTGVSQIPFTFIQASGLPKKTAVLHFTEMLFYVPGIIYFVHAYGIIGAAIARLLRIIIDTSALFYFSIKISEISYLLRSTVIGGLLTVLFFVLSQIIESFYLRVIIWITYLIIHGWVSWHYIIPTEIKINLNKLFSR